MKHDIGFSFITIEEASKALSWCNSYTRLPTLLDISYRMDQDDWLRLLGREWSGCDNIGHYIDDLIDSPLCWTWESGPKVKRDMMNLDEQAAYDALPDVVTVYRGCYKPNKWGFSWSLSKEIAERFPTLNRYRQRGQALLVTAQAKKEHIIAVKLDRDEREIITWRPKHLSTRHINQWSMQPIAGTNAPYAAFSPPGIPPH